MADPRPDGRPERQTTAYAGQWPGSGDHWAGAEQMTTTSEGTEARVGRWRAALTGGDLGAPAVLAARWSLPAVGCLLVLAVLVVLDDTGEIRAGPNRPLRVLLEGLQAAVMGLAALLVYGRMRVSRSSSDAAVVASLGLMAGTNLVVAFGLSSPMAAAGSALEAGLDWGAVGARLVAACCLAIGAVGPRRRWRDGLPAGAVAAGALAIPVLFSAAAWALAAAGLPPAVAGEGPGPSTGVVFRAHPALTAIQAVLLAMWLASAVGFAVRGRRLGDRFLSRLGMAAALGVVARVQFLLFPSLYTDVVRVGDALRFADHLVLVSAAVAEIRSYWAAEAVVAAQQERQRLARVVHDGLVQDLCFLRSAAASVAAGRSHPELASYVGEAVDRAYEESRRLLTVLDGPPLSLLAAGGTGLGVDDPLQGLRVEVEALTARAGVDAEVRWPRHPAGHEHEARALHGIAREAVANAVRHARPSRVSVEVWPEAGCALRVSDDGIGIDGRADAGFGRRAMTDLAAELDADLWVGAGPEGGTMVEVRRR